MRNTIPEASAGALFFTALLKGVENKEIAFREEVFAEEGVGGCRCLEKGETRVRPKLQLEPKWLGRGNTGEAQASV